MNAIDQDVVEVKARKKRLRDVQYYKLNTDAWRAYQREYYARNREKIAAQKLAWRRAQSPEWHEQNRKKVSEYKRSRRKYFQWRQKILRAARTEVLNTGKPLLDILVEWRAPESMIKRVRTG
jgi:hypothetical protein